MAGRIRHTGPVGKVIRDIGETYPRLDPAEIAKALGAEPTNMKLELNLGPISLLAVRQELLRRLQSSGAPPVPQGVDRGVDIHVSDEQWSRLEKIAATVAAPGYVPTAEQVACVLLGMALRSLDTQTSHGD